MNLKKISVYGLVLAFVGIFGILTANYVSAISVATSGIDNEASYIQITFEEEAGTGNADRFLCFGLTNSPALILFSDLGITFDGSGNGSVVIPDATNCFQQAGTYTVLIHLEDKAGNGVDKAPYKFLVKATNPSASTTVITPSDCTGKFANNTDTCSLEFELKDAFSNPVTQIGNANLELDSEFTDDANEGLNFVDGLRRNGADFSNPFDLTSTLGKFSFSLKAVAPSIKKVGNYFAELVGRALTFDMITREIDSYGDLLATTKTEAIQTEGVEFGHLFELVPSGSGFVWEGGDMTEGTINLDLDVRNPGYGPTNRTGTLSEENANLKYENTSLPESLSFNGVVYQEVATQISPASDGGTFNPDEMLSLVTDIEYVVNDGASDFTIQYPAGGSGLDGSIVGTSQSAVIGYNANIAVDVVGADIEGGVIGNLTEMEELLKTGVETFNISQSIVKLRDQITENVFRLSRGSSNIKTSGGIFMTDWFDAYDVVIVEVQNDNVIFPVGGTVPEGKKTLIIKNGNFIVKGDMAYQNLDDSFGIILINEDQNEQEEGTGNIFVQSGVRTMVGSYYADGGLMTNNEAVPTVENSINAESHPDLYEQLLLTGTLFSQNTLGGSMILSGDEEYFVPWGTTSDKTLARKYDLHYVRRYQPDLNPNDGTPDDNLAQCAPAEGACDDNKNAFVIRIDRKASVAPPPGFESSGDIVR
jgi:hypothetical protein